MFGLLGQLAQKLASNPQLMAALAIHIPRAIERLSPENKRKLANIVRWGVEQAARYALTSVLGEVGNRVVSQVVNDPQVEEVAKDLVKRGVAVGVDKALSEAKLT